MITIVAIVVVQHPAARGGRVLLHVVVRAARSGRILSQTPAVGRSAELGGRITGVVVVIQ